MSTGALRSLTIENIRGCAAPFTLTFDKPLTILYGENGTGKTTLCDALDLLGSDRMGSLSDKGLGPAAHRYWGPAGKPQAVGTVELTTATDTSRATIAGAKVSRQGPAVRVSVLRRAEILRVVTAAPADRYAAIATFIDVEKVSASEAALAELVKAAKAEHDRHSQRLGGNLEILKERGKRAGESPEDPLAWARSLPLRDLAAMAAERDRWAALEAGYASLSNRASGADRVLSEEAEARRTHGTCEKALAAASAAHGEAAQELLGLLDAAAKMLAGGPRKDCPLCGGTDRAEHLTERIEARRSELRTLHEARVAATAARTALDRAEAATRHLHQAYEEERSRFVLQVLPEGVTSPPAHVRELATWLAAHADERARWREAHKAASDHHAEEANFQDAVKTCEENRRQAESTGVLVTRLEQALGAMTDTRRTFVNDILVGVSEEVGRLYEQVHPDEKKGSIALRLDPKKRASLELQTQFSDTADVPPQAYFSESHLDTLGVCVFLALQRRSDPGATILVLDDVMASVDEPHVERLVEMLYEEAQVFRHVLMTTHYRPWKEKFRWGWLSHGQCQLIELGAWSEQSGPAVSTHRSEVERLRALLARADDRDHQSIAAKAGVVLEAVLDFLTELYQCRLPRKPRKDWSLGDLLHSLSRKLRESLRVEILAADDSQTYTSHPLGPLLEELLRTAQTRNVLGAHFNRLANELSGRHADDFGRLVLKLADLLVDPEAGWPKSDKSGSYWATKTETRRLHPLREPQ
ncbi:MAG: hypothetical protein RL199_951 [Pseudomonadota bacterium]|jgi:energy-coupling factor transporter ATP-binding protein EcfA2